MAQYHFDPEHYDALMDAEVPAYRQLQAAVARACTEAGSGGRALELGTGTGTTATAVMASRPLDSLVGLDSGPAMAAVARERLPDADVRLARLQDPLPDGPFDLVFSALAVHHLDAGEKADLFARVAGVLAPAGRFVLGDLVVPEDPADVVTPIDGVYDLPSPAGEQLRWLRDAGLRAHLAWADRDLAVLVGDAYRAPIS